MAIAKVKLDDLKKYKEQIEAFLCVLKDTQNKGDTLERVDNDIRKEVDEYEVASSECEQIISKLNNILKQLENKAHWLEQGIKVLKLEIVALEADIARLTAAVVAAPPPLKASAVMQLRQVKEKLQHAENAKKDLEEKLKKTECDIKTTENLINQSEQKQSQIQESISALNEASENLRNVINELNDLLQKLISDSRCSLDNLSKSVEYVNRYLEISIDKLEFSPRGSVTLRKCINLQYAGRIYDYSASRDDNGQLFTPEKIRYFQEKYPGIKFSKIDSYGNTYPDFSGVEIFSYKFPPVTKENLVNGTCLIGDSKGGSADFKKFRAAMENAGYSKQQIAELLSTHTIHHDEDGCTLRLIPRDLHEACRHNGGAEKIRLQIAML